MSGWIKLHRSLKDWEWYSDHNTTRLLIHLLISVNYEDKQWKNEIVKAGTMITSWENLSYETGLSLKQVRTAMSKLERGRQVGRQVAGKGASKWQVITLVKWDKLQGEGQENGQENGSKLGRKRATTKEVKNKEVKNNTSTSIKIDIEDSKPPKKDFDFKAHLLSLGIDDGLVNDFLAVRKAKKAVNTENAFKGLVREIKKAQISPHEAIEMCVHKSWKGFEATWYHNEIQKNNQFNFNPQPSNNVKTQKQHENEHHNAHALKHLRSFEREGDFSARTIEIARNFCLTTTAHVNVYELIPKLEQLEERLQNADQGHSGDTLWLGL